MLKKERGSAQSMDGLERRNAGGGEEEIKHL